MTVKQNLFIVRLMLSNLKYVFNDPRKKREKEKAFTLSALICLTLTNIPFDLEFSNLNVWICIVTDICLGARINQRYKYSTAPQ